MRAQERHGCPKGRAVRNGSFRHLLEGVPAFFTGAKLVHEKSLSTAGQPGAVGRAGASRGNERAAERAGSVAQEKGSSHRNASSEVS